MPVMKAHYSDDINKLSPVEKNNSSASGNVTKVSVVLTFPPNYTLTNMHVWFIYVANQFFVQNQWRPEFVCSIQKEWKNYQDILEYLYDYLRIHNSFKGLMTPILDHTDDLDKVIDYGKQIVLEWEDLIQVIDADIRGFLQEVKLPAILKENEHLFSIWYGNKFEATSHVHRDVYRSRASNSNTTAMISTILLTMPQKIESLAHKKITALDTHVHSWTYNERTFLLECHCGAEQSVQSHYQNTY